MFLRRTSLTARMAEAGMFWLAATRLAALGPQEIHASFKCLRYPSSVSDK
jgi:hypothetical protein